MDIAPVVPSLSATGDATDDELMRKGLPQISVPCTTITITNKHVLKKAAKKLRVSIHGYTFTSLDNDDMTASVSMDIPPHKGNPTMTKREFYGEWAMFSDEAKESACLAALTYLRNEGLILVNDTHSAELKEYKRKYEAEKFWSSMLYDRAFTLQQQSSGHVTTVLQITRPEAHERTAFSATPPDRTASTSTSSKTSSEKARPCNGARRALFPQE